MTANRTFGRLWAAQLARARTKRGVVTTICAALVVLAVASSSSSPAAAFAGLVLFSPVLWWITWGVLGLFVLAWERLVDGQPPSVKVGRAWQSGTATRKQLREDANATLFVDRGGILLRQRRWFIASGTPPVRVDPNLYVWAAAEQLSNPVPITSFRDRSYWWYQDAFYWTNADYGSGDVKALLYARERRQQRELEHAHAVMAAASAPAERKREPIPRDVKLAVFERDEGRCVECGSEFDIQYDHVIPFSMGGANTVENLQLLCARCNQTKGGRP
jgi:hypothetical protein